jgi:hypothetical protein
MLRIGFGFVFSVCVGLVVRASQFEPSCEREPSSEIETKPATYLSRTSISGRTYCVEEVREIVGQSRKRFSSRCC